MSKNKWFSDVFLPSIFERAGINNSMGLTLKQTEVCRNYMDCQRMRRDSGSMYMIAWRGRSVWLRVSNKTGCGAISFGMDAQEREACMREMEQEQKQAAADRFDALIDRLKGNPAQLEKQIEKYRRILAETENEYAEDREALDAEEIAYYVERIAELRGKLNALLPLSEAASIVPAM